MTDVELHHGGPDRPGRETPGSSPASGAPVDGFDEVESADAGPTRVDAGSARPGATAGSAQPGAGTADGRRLHREPGEQPGAAPGAAGRAGGGWLAPATGPAKGTAAARRRTNRRLAAVGVVLVGAVVFLLVKGIGTSLDYYVTVHQALSERSSLAGKTFRLRGIVAPDTIRHQGSVVDFAVEESHQRIDVIEHGSPPQLFKVGIPVIVQGRFDGSTFVSDQVIVDHTGNYSPQRDGPRSAGSSTAGSSTAGSSTAGSSTAGSSSGPGTHAGTSAGASALRAGAVAGSRAAGAGR